MKNAEAFKTFCKHYNNVKTLETRRIKEILVWFWGFAGNFMTSLQSTYIHINEIMHIVVLLLRDHPTVRNRLNRPPTRRDCDNVWAPLKFNDCLAWPLTSNSNRMLSLLAMLKLVTLKGCFHNMQRNAEQHRVKYVKHSTLLWYLQPFYLSLIHISEPTRPY